jgi:hypothetical protein
MIDQPGPGRTRHEALEHFRRDRETFWHRQARADQAREAGGFSAVLGSSITKFDEIVHGGSTNHMIVSCGPLFSCWC